MRFRPALCFVFLLAAASHAEAGTIEGTVANMSSGTRATCQVQVVLQILANGQFSPLCDTVSDKEGHFRFDRLPTGDKCVYQAGATFNGVFYPGPRIVLAGNHTGARVKLKVYDAITGPSPLVLKKMEVTIHPETGLLRVTERLLVNNPSNTCFVGKADHAGAYPITLELAIPPDFERTTFDKEFFGRHFVIVNNKVATSIPWPPGEQEVRYTYVIRNAQEKTTWQRAIDLPCDDVTIQVDGKTSDEIHSELPAQNDDAKKAAILASPGRAFPAGYVLRVDLGRVPLPWMTYGKWAATGIMILLIATGAWFHFRRGKAGFTNNVLSKIESAPLPKKRAA